MQEIYIIKNPRNGEEIQIYKRTMEDILKVLYYRKANLYDIMKDKIELLEQQNINDDYFKEI